MKFSDRIKKGFADKRREALPEEKKKEVQTQKIEQVFEKLVSKENRYIFYCPDIPFATSLMKTIYQIAYEGKEAGFNTLVLHEVPGFNPRNFLKEEWVKDVPVKYIQKKQSKHKISTTFSFDATDTIIIPDGFWSVMEAFHDVKGLQKVVLAVGYGGIITTPPGLNWAELGFTDVICTNEFIAQEYSSLWPWLNYHIVPYYIDDYSFIPLERGEVYPAIALSCRSREMANSILNVFYNHYPFLDLIDFKILKRLDSTEFQDVLSHCSCLVLVDEQAADCPTPYEALKLNVPSIVSYGRGYEEIANLTKDIPNSMFFTSTDVFEIATAIAEFCYGWLYRENDVFDSTSVLQTKSKKQTKEKSFEVLSLLQENRIQHFTAIKEAIEKTYNQESLIQ